VHEMDLEWRKSSFSGGEGGQCVESPRLPMVDAIRVTLKTGAVRRSISPPPSGDVVVLGVKNGEFD